MPDNKNLRICNTGIHTITLLQKINKDLFNYLLNKLYEYAKINRCRLIDHTQQDSNCLSWVFYPKIRGINIEFYKTYDGNNGKFKNYFVNYIVNPYLIDNFEGNYFNIYTNRNFTDICDIIYEITNSIDPSLPYMKHMTVTRIDFCKNIFLYNQSAVRLYIDLLKKYDGRDNFKLIRLKNRDGIEYPYETSTTLRKKKGYVEIYVYDKHCQMSSKPNVYPPEDIELSYGIFRIEIRMKNQKLYYEKSKFGTVDDTVEFLNKSIAKAKHYFEFYLKKVFLEGDYYRYHEALSIIDRSSYTSKVKQNLKKLVEYVSYYQGLQKGINRVKSDMAASGEYKPEHLKRKVAELLKRFNELKLNPVTLSRNQRSDHLPNLHYYFDNSKEDGID